MNNPALSCAEQRLPKFANPPVVETIIGVDFLPVKAIKNAHLGLFWQDIGTEKWPQIDEAAPAEPQIERFGEGVPLELRNINLHFTTAGAPNRVRIRNQEEDRMIQVQNGIFRYNWLGHKEDNRYPDFKKVKEEFDKYYSRFQRFSTEKRLGEIHPKQWEITYINHLEKDTVWSAPEDLSAVFPSLLGSLRGLAATGTPMESFSGRWCYVIGDKQGRLHVTLRHAQKGDSREIFVLTLAARGPALTDKEVHDGIELGHKTIVHAFKELTSDDAHSYWRIINDD